MAQILGTSTFLASLLVTIRVEALETPFFDREKFVVVFSPYVHPITFLNELDEADLLPLVRKVSTIFSQVFVRTDFDKPYLISHHQITNSIALYNKELIPHLKTNSTITVYLQYDLDSNSYTNNQSRFDQTLEIAEEANSIAPETVKYIIVSSYMMMESLNAELPEFITYLRKAKEKLEEKGIKLGISLPVDHCMSTMVLMPYLEQILSIVQFASFVHHTTQIDHEAGVEATTKGFMAEFEKCKRNIMRKFENSLEIAFETNWADMDDTAVQNYASLVAFWLEMNNWGTITNTKIIMNEAFDYPAKGEHYGSMGWWRATYRSAHRGTSNLIYENKMEASVRAGEREVVNLTAEAIVEASTQVHHIPGKL